MCIRFSTECSTQVWELGPAEGGVMFFLSELYVLSSNIMNGRLKLEDEQNTIRIQQEHNYNTNQIQTE